MVYLDYAEAFDKVDLAVLLHKIGNFRITGHLVPRGTVLALLLFTLLI